MEGAETNLDAELTDVADRHGRQGNDFNAELAGPAEFFLVFLSSWKNSPRPPRAPRLIVSAVSRDRLRGLSPRAAPECAEREERASNRYGVSRAT